MFSGNDCSVAECIYSGTFGNQFTENFTLTMLPNTEYYFLIDYFFTEDQNNSTILFECIEEVPDSCHNDLDLTNTTFPRLGFENDLYRSSTYIQLQDNSSSSNANIFLSAKDSIIVNSMMEIEKGAQFEFRIQNCESNEGLFEWYDAINRPR